MFEIGFSEMLIVAVVALIVLGPERLPRAAQFVGLWVRKARAHWFSMKAELERELAADELRRSLRDSGEEIERELRAASDATRKAMSPDTVADDVSDASNTIASNPSGTRPAGTSGHDAPDSARRNDDSHDGDARDDDKPPAS